MNIINTLIIIFIGLIIVNLSSCYNIEGITSCNVEDLGLGDPRYKNTDDYTGYYKGSDGYYEGIRPSGIKIDSTGTQHAALDCLHSIGLTDIIDLVEDENFDDRQIKINTTKTGDYNFEDDRGGRYNLNAWNTSYSHDVDYYDDFKYGLIKNISLSPSIELPSWL